MTFGLVLVIALTSWIVAVAAGRSAARGPFSPWRWIMSSGMRSREMALDYLQHHFVEGMTVEEVLADLGDPVHPDHFWSLKYDTTPDDPSTPSYMESMRPQLVVWFGMDGRVTQVSGYHMPEDGELRDFDGTAWWEAAHGDRTAMSRALIRDGLPDAMNKDDVVSLLGRPDRGSGELSFRYLVGSHSEFEFRVGTDGRIAHAWVDGAD